MSATAPTRQAWLFGPLPDLFLGCGAGYLLLLGLAFLPAFAESASPWIVFGASLTALVTNAPHYGATILRVYERREERRRFALFAVWATAALALLFVGGVYHQLLGSLLITLYVTWSPWHFAGQNYGLGLMFLRRRGVEVTPRTKRLFYASFLLSVALALLILHRASGTLAIAPVPTLAGDYRMLSLGIPPAFVDAVLPVVFAAYAAVLVAVAVPLLRQVGPAALAPTGLLVLTQAAWFSVPSLLHYRGSFAVTNLALSAFVISVAHSVQYLWVTSYYATRSQSHERLRVYLGKTLLVGAALFVLPVLALAPSWTGAVSYAAGLSTVLFSAVNLHHFVLDGAIWKLRDGRVARVLLRPASDPGAERPPAIDAPPRRSWLRPLVWSAAGVCMALSLFNVWEREVGVQRALAAGDLERASTALERLRWIGHEDYTLHRDLADAYARRDAGLAGSDGGGALFDDARRHYRRSLELHPSPEAWLGLGNVRQALGDLPGARAAYREALSLEPLHYRVLDRLGEAWLAEGELERARAMLEQAAALAPEDRRIRLALARLARAERAAAKATATLEP